MPDMICDASTLQLLDQAGVFGLLEKLYERVVVPEIVATEMAEGRSGGATVPDLAAFAWIETRPVRGVDAVSVKSGLGPAERATLALAMETPGAVVVTDDPVAKRHAQMLRQPCTGTLGILLRAKQKKLVNRIAPIIDKLESRGFKLHPTTRSAVLAWAKETT
jgi:predicted nucleic acid-binding protein